MRTKVKDIYRDIYKKIHELLSHKVLNIMQMTEIKAKVNLFSIISSPGLYSFPEMCCVFAVLRKQCVFRSLMNHLCLMDLLKYFLFTITLLFAFLRTTVYGVAIGGGKQCCYNIYISAKLNQKQRQHLLQVFQFGFKGKEHPC